MKFLNGLTLLLVFQLIGEVCSAMLEIPVSGPVIGMLLLFVSLFFMDIKGGAKSAVEHSSLAILGHLSLLFVPAGVGLMIHFDRVIDEFLPLGVSVLLGVIISLVSIAWLMQLMVRAKSNRRGQHE
jgi:holin-like protein